MAKKRANGEGNIRKRKDGRWEGRYTAGHDPVTGKQIFKNVLGKNAKITHVYIPAVEGVEKRKNAPSAEGLLGVEGIDVETLLAAFERAGIGSEKVEQKSDLTTADLFSAHLTGAANCAERRRELLKRLNLPPRLSNRNMLLMLNTLLTREEFFELVASIPE